MNQFFLCQKLADFLSLHETSLESAPEAFKKAVSLVQLDANAARKMIEALTVRNKEGNTGLWQIVRYCPENLSLIADLLKSTNSEEIIHKAYASQIENDKFDHFGILYECMLHAPAMLTPLKTDIEEMYLSILNQLDKEIKNLDTDSTITCKALILVNEVRELKNQAITLTDIVILIKMLMLENELLHLPTQKNINIFQTELNVSILLSDNLGLFSHPQEKLNQVANALVEEEFKIHKSCDF
ncbi:MAG: hypothetical protein H0W64_01275 [Gammaproteobacteria bacterium]|nr:hypothetical protein [Gammaproteobacteria bacterium]